MAIELAWATDPGLHREENEDSVLVWRNRAGVEALLIVCDGMGGHAAGHLASSIASETISSHLERDGRKGPEIERLRNACSQANAAVFEASKRVPEWAGMGSTLVVVAIDNSKLALLNVGDSPAYLYRNGTVQLISQDHSWPAEQVRLGVITPEEAVDHPMKHRLTRAVGVWEQIQPYATDLSLEPGDMIVLASDGVETAGVTLPELRGMLNGDLNQGVQAVVDLCREKGAPDNITVAVARLQPAEAKTVTLPIIRKLGQ
jgi:protein phosphatase